MGSWGKRWDRLPGQKKPRDPLPALLADQCVKAGLKRPMTEFKFAEGRRFKADCCWPDDKLIVEVQGAVHRIKARFQADRERSQVIAILGYRLMLIAPKDVIDGKATELIRQALCRTPPNS